MLSTKDDAVRLHVRPGEGDEVGEYSVRVRRLDYDRTVCHNREVGGKVTGVNRS